VVVAVLRCGGGWSFAVVFTT